MKRSRSEGRASDGGVDRDNIDLMVAKSKLEHEEKIFLKFLRIRKFLVAKARVIANDLDGTTLNPEP